MTLQLLSFGSGGWGGMLALGALMTFAVATCAFGVGLVFGACAALASRSGRLVLRLPAFVYTTIVRGIPELLVIYLFFFGASSLVMAIVRLTFGYDGYIEVPAFAVGVIAVGLISGAYSSEVIRGAIASVPKGQVEAAMALGLKRWVIATRVLFPQALRVALPGLNNVWQLTLKDTALISVTGLAEIMRSANIASGVTREPFTFYAAAALAYLLFTWASSRLFARAEAFAGRGMIGARA
jgi:octopine/nopaline transport system permease protein